jgi:hypothetical protein
MGGAPPCKNGCITTSGQPRRHYENNCPLVRKERIAQMNFAGIHLLFLKLTAAEFAALQTTEPPPAALQTTEPSPAALQTTEPSPAALQPTRPPTAAISTAAITRSPEIPSPSPVNAARFIPESPSTPTPRQSWRPLGSPIKRSRAPMVSQLLSESRVDPELLQIRNRPAESSNAGSPTGEEWEEDQEEPQENTKDVVGALVIKSRSQDREGSQVSEVKRRLTSEEMVYQTNKRKRETFYRNASERLRENVRKIGIVTGCYGILYIHRHILIPFSILLLIM